MKLAVNIVALGSLWGCFYLNPETSWSGRQWRTFTLFALCTVMMLSHGLSPWAWGHAAAEWALICLVAAFGLTHFYLLWQEAKPTPAR